MDTTANPKKTFAIASKVQSIIWLSIINRFHSPILIPNSNPNSSYGYDSSSDPNSNSEFLLACRGEEQSLNLTLYWNHVYYIDYTSIPKPKKLSLKITIKFHILFA